VLVTYEDHHRETGLGAALAARILERDLHVRLVRLGVREYATSGTPEEILRSQGLDADSLKAVIRRLAGLGKSDPRSRMHSPPPRRPSKPERTKPRRRHSRRLRLRAGI
jgi:hypothetical protein